MHKSSKLFQLKDILRALDDFNIRYEIVSDQFDEIIEYSFKSLKKIERRGIYYIARGVQCEIQDSILITNDALSANTNTVILVEEDPQLVFYKLMDLFFSNEIHFPYWFRVVVPCCQRGACFRPVGTSRRYQKASG